MKDKLELRPYQKKAVSAVISRYRDLKSHRMLLHLPTGSGKTVIAAFIIRELLSVPDFGRVLFVAHRQEILNQTVRTIKHLLPQLDVQIEQGENRGTGDAIITVASVQSLVRRKEQYDPSLYSLIICDECHRALAPSWVEVIDYFNVNSRENTLIVGMTATPKRTDGRSALEMFGDVAYHITRLELEELGYLVPMKYFTVRSDLNLVDVKVSGGDFQVKSLSNVMDSPRLRALTLRAWMEKGSGKKTIAFCAGIDHANNLAQAFRSLGLRAEKIDGKTKERGELLRDFSNGKIDIITNYGVLTEGFDEPSVECILMARPTQSPLVYTQCIGRGLRPSPNKDSCLVIDIIDRATNHLQYGAIEMAGLPKTWKSSGGDPFRDSRSISGIKVTSPQAFSDIRSASSIEEVQSILTNLLPGVVVAGLDGETVEWLSNAATEDALTNDTFEPWISRYMGAEVIGYKSENTRQAKEYDFRIFTDWYVKTKGHMKIKEWLSRDTAKFIRDLEEKGLTASTVNRTLSTLRRFARWTHDQGESPFAAGLPTRGVKDQDIEGTEVRRLSREEIGQIFTAADKLVLVDKRKNSNPRRDRAILSLIYHAGLQVSELCSLKLKQLEGCNLINVDRDDKTKNKKTSISGECQDHILDYLENEREQDSINGASYLILGPDKTIPLSRTAAWRALKRIVNEVNSHTKHNLQVNPRMLQHAKEALEGKE